MDQLFSIYLTFTGFDQAPLALKSASLSHQHPLVSKQCRILYPHEHHRLRSARLPQIDLGLNYAIRRPRELSLPDSFRPPA